jgi:hypothetical protein
MMIAVNTKSGIQDIRNLLVFSLWPAGHSFADRIVVLAACRRNDARSLALEVVSIPGARRERFPGVGGDRGQREV